jgi:ActR/RegA family two-component response regulator
MWLRMLQRRDPQGPHDRVPILVVEDDAAFRYCLARSLASNFAEPIEADGTIAALNLLDADPRIERAVIDVRMPAQQPNGLAFALMARHRRRAMRCVLLSAHPEYQGVADFEAFGGVLSKSTDLPVLTVAIFKRLELGTPS